MHDIFYAMLHFCFCKALDSYKRLIHLKYLKIRWDLLCALWVDTAIVCLILQQQRKLTTGHLADLSAHIIRVKQDGTEQQKQVFLLKAQESSFQCKIALCNVSLH